MKWWNIYLETFGMPTRIAQFPAGIYMQSVGGENASQTRLQAILKDIMQATAITIPDDIKLEFKEASMGGSVSFQRAIEYHDLMMIIGIQGQVLTQQSGGPGSFALGKVHELTKADYTAILRTNLEDVVVGEQVIKQLVDLNFSVEQYPRFVMMPRAKQIEDFTADEIVKFSQIGVVRENDIDILRRKIGLPSREQAAAMDAGSSAPIATKPENISGQFSRFALARKPNKYETRSDFKRIDDDMRRADETMMESLSPIVNTMKNKMIAYLPNLFTDGKLDLLKWKDLKLIGLKDFAAAYEENILNVMLNQLEASYSEVDGGALAGQKKADQVKFASIKMEDQRLPENEIAIITGWRESGNWEKLRAWRESKSKELRKLGESEAFWITDVVRDDILRETKDAIMAGVRNGADTRSISKSVGSVFEKYIERGDIANKQLASAPRLEKIVRTNVNRAFNIARKQAFVEASATGDFPAMEFSAILDDRISDICESLDGQVYPVDDPIWSTITPPLHENCRSTIVPIYKDDVPEKWATPPEQVNDIRIEFGGTKG
jgi:SPP1 gp7 family putative phage head morphogenesis protein